MCIRTRPRKYIEAGKCPAELQAGLGGGCSRSGWNGGGGGLASGLGWLHSSLGGSQLTSEKAVKAVVEWALQGHGRGGKDCLDEEQIFIGDGDLFG